MIPPAALAVIEAAYEDARRRGENAHRARQRAAHALERDGWTIAPARQSKGRQTPTQHAASGSVEPLPTTFAA